MAPNRSLLEHINRETSSGIHDETSEGLGNGMTYRQKRRLQQAQRTGPKRKSTTGKKYVHARLTNQNLKPYAKITEEMNRIVGDNANQFITEVGVWVKNYCPLNSRNWTRMDSEAKGRLYKRIKEEWRLPEGGHVDRALSLQCQILYKQWRYRLKERYFNGFSISRAISNRPETIDPVVWRWLVVDFWSSSKQKHISEVNRANKLKQIEISRNGGKSTARYLHEIEQEPSNGNVDEESSEECEQEPDYIRLWEKTKRKRDGTWEDGAHAKYQKLIELHDKQMELHGIDNLSVKEAYTQAFVPCSGYVRGLGAGPVPLKSRKDNEIEVGLRQKIEEIEHTNAEREENLRLEMERMKEAAREREAKIMQDAYAREQKLREEAEEREMKLREEVKERERKFREITEQRETKLRAEAEARDRRLKEEMMKVMKEQMAGFMVAQQSTYLNKLL